MDENKKNTVENEFNIEINFGKAKVELTLYANSEDRAKAIDSVNNILKEKLLKDSIVMVNYPVKQELQVKALYYNDKCILSVKNKIKERGFEAKKIYRLEGNKILDASEKEFKLDKSHKLDKSEIEGIEYTILDKQFGEQKNEVKSSKIEYIMQEKGTCVEEAKNKVKDNVKYNKKDKVKDSYKKGKVKSKLNKIKNQLDKIQKLFSGDKKSIKIPRSGSDSTIKNSSEIDNISDSKIKKSNRKIKKSDSEKTLNKNMM